MHRRSYFHAVLVGYEDASKSNFLGKFLQHLASMNRALIILGDSLSFQTLSTIQCELHREQIEFEKGGDTIIALEGRGVYTYHFKEINASVDVHYKRLDNIRLSHQYSMLDQELEVFKSC